jgi:hypothetical protein
MQEFESISASSYDPSALATKLTAKAAEGWSVVAIVPTGGDVTAFVCRDKGSTDLAKTADTSEPTIDKVEDNADEPKVESTIDEQAADDAADIRLPDTTAPWAEASTESPESTSVEASPEAVSEPSGWAIAPEPANPKPEPTGVQPSVGTSTYEPSATPTYEPAATPAATTPSAPTRAPEAVAAPAVPAGWYADPAGRFELRYWDGSTWTEHVSRAGQQFTDPPVA